MTDEERAERDKAIAAAFRANPKRMQKDVAADLGVKLATVRNVLIKLRNEGLADWEQPKAREPSTVSVKVASSSTSILEPDKFSSRVTLPKFSFSMPEIEPPTPRLRMKMPIPKMTPEEEARMRRIAKLKEIHQAGLRRGLFQVRSR